MKTVGVMRICDEFVEEINLTIGSLAAFCDEVCFLSHYLSNPEILSAIHSCNNFVEIREYEGDTRDHYSSIDQAYRLADDHDADWIVMQDQDELLPFPKLNKMIVAMQESSNDTLYLPIVNCWGTPYRIVYPKLNKTDNHCKVYQGRNSEFTVIGGVGCSVPSSPHKLYWGKYPYRHMAFMTEGCRERRLFISDGRCRSQPWSETTPPVFPWRPDWTIDQWVEQI